MIMVILRGIFALLPITGAIAVFFGTRNQSLRPITRVLKIILAFFIPIIGLFFSIKWVVGASQAQ